MIAWELNGKSVLLVLEVVNLKDRGVYRLSLWGEHLFLNQLKP